MKMLELNQEFFKRFNEAKDASLFKGDEMLYLLIACNPGLDKQKLEKLCKNEDVNFDCLIEYIENGFIKEQNGKYFAI